MQIKATTSLLRFWLILVLVVRLFAGADHLHLFRGRSVQVCKVGGGRELFHRDQSHWIRGLQCRKDSRLRARLDAEERFTSILKNALHHTHTHTQALGGGRQASKQRWRWKRQVWDDNIICNLRSGRWFFDSFAPHRYHKFRRLLLTNNKLVPPTNEQEW